MALTIPTYLMGEMTLASFLEWLVALCKTVNSYLLQNCSKCLPVGKNERRSWLSDFKGQEMKRTPQFPDFSIVEPLWKVQLVHFRYLLLALHSCQTKPFAVYSWPSDAVWPFREISAVCKKYDVRGCSLRFPTRDMFCQQRGKKKIYKIVLLVPMLCRWRSIIKKCTNVFIFTPSKTNRALYLIITVTMFYKTFSI